MGIGRLRLRESTADIRDNQIGRRRLLIREAASGAQLGRIDVVTFRTRRYDSTFNSRNIMGSRNKFLLWACTLAFISAGCAQEQAKSPTLVADASPAPQIVSRPPINPTTEPGANRYRLTDCHLHLVDFLQRTDGIRAALAAMDRAGVEEAIIHGMPLVKEWPQNERLRPEYYLEDDSRCYWYSATDVWWRARCNRCRRISNGGFIRPSAASTAPTATPSITSSA